MHIKCGGYVKKIRKEQQCSPPHRLLRLVPKLSPPSNTATPIMYNPQPHFANCDEYRYFKIFCDNTAPNLAEYLDSALWNTIVLQASEQESFIKHAIVALGALDKTVEVSRTLHGPQVCSGTSHTSHYQAAFQQYGKCIKGIRKACEERRQSKRMILIACLLAVCFEYFDGNIDPAIAHIRSGIRLINDWAYGIMHLASIDQQQQHFLPGILEDELVCVFSRLEVDVFTWYDTDKVVMHKELAQMAMDIVRAIPTDGFTNIQSARKYFDILLREVDWFIRSMSDQLWARWNEPIDSRQSSTDQRERLGILQQSLLSWFTAFQFLYSRSLTSRETDFLIIKALYLRHTCSSIALNCCSGSELCYDSYIPQFRNALSLAQTLSAATFSKAKPTFVVWSILVKSLYFIALKCRNLPLRKEALASLQAMTRREGLWDAGVACAIVRKVIELEQCERDLRNIFVPEKRRLRAIKTTFDLHQRRGNLRYLTLKTDSEAVGLVAGQVELSW